MKDIKCPKCGEIFKIDDASYASIIKQVHDEEFDKEIHRIEKQFEQDMKSAVTVAEITIKSQKEEEINKLKQRLLEVESEKEMRVEKLESELKLEKANSEKAIEKAVQSKEVELIQLKSDMKLAEGKHKAEEQALKDKYTEELKMKDEQIQYYRDFKAKQSTKMIGESLEQHCETEFNKLRATAFSNAYFEKDNDIKSGSKGDFIYRECSDDDIEFISIMFEMKNEMDQTSTKHKNEDFFKELDKDRKEKNCEYAVLVSLLESDNEFYNSGIADVSYKYDKMYVIRPQFFIPLITILRNAALKSLKYRQELENVKNQNIDISKFESSMQAFKEDFSRNVEIAGKKFGTAIDEIDKSIDHLQKIKENLLASNHQLQIANRKADDLSIKRLTKDNPTMQKRFAELHET